MHIVTANAFIRAEPNDVFAVNKNRQNFIRAQTAGSIEKRKIIELIFAFKTKNAVIIRADPRVVLIVEGNRVDISQAAADSFRLEKIFGGK